MQRPIKALVFLVALGLVRPLAAQEFAHDAFASISGEVSIEEEIIALVNVERRQRGLGELKYDRNLRSAARQHSRDMLDQGYFSHDAPDSSLRHPVDRVYYAGLTDFVVGENIAVNSAIGGARSIARVFVEQWMNSPGHRENILRPNFTHIGVGVRIRMDSSTIDTVIGGLPAKWHTKSIRNMGTQVFSDRDIEIESLQIHVQETPMIHLTARFQCERSLLVTYGEFSRIFSSVGGETKVEVSYPLQKDGELQIAYAENENTEEYVIMVRLPLNGRVQIPTLYDRLQGLTFPVLDREIKINRTTLRWLKGNFRWIGKGKKGECFAYTGDDAFDCHDTSIHVPLWESTGELTLGCGGGRQKTIKHRIRIDPQSPDGFGRY